MQTMVGFDGYCRYEDEGSWCPVYIILANEDQDVEGELRITAGGTSDDAEINVYARQIMLPAHSRKAYSLVIPTVGSPARSRLRVQLLAGGKVLASEQVTGEWLGKQEWLYGIISSNPSALNFLSDVAPLGWKSVVAHLNLDTLPSDPLGWEGLNVLILNDIDTTVLSREQRQALHSWVAHGGHLIVGGGVGASRTAAGVTDLLPVTVGGTRSVGGLWALGEQLGVPVATGPYAVAQASLRAGEVAIEQTAQVEQGDLILLARRTYGAGKVDFLAFDAGLRPFVHWEDNARLWDFIIGTEATEAQRIIVRNGYSAREAIYAIPGLKFPSTLQILAFMLLYTLLIGPINYVILRKFDRRELAWLTIPALIVGFTACAYLTGFQIRGNTPIIHRLAVVYVPENADTDREDSQNATVEKGRVSQAVGLFSPRRTNYDVWVAGIGVREIPDIPYRGYGGPTRQPLHIVTDAEGTTVTDLRVDVGGIFPFVAEGYVDVPAIEAELQLAAEAASGLRLEGTVRNGYLPLKDAVLIVGDDEQRLGDLEAGEEVNVGLSFHSGSGAVVPGSAPPIPPYSYRIAEQILGPGDYWENRESYRRYQFLQAVFPYDGPGLKPGVYLVGWAEEDAPLPARVVGRSDLEATALDITLYIYALPITGLEAGTTITIPSALITRQVEETTGYVDVWPEGFHMEPEAEIVFRFTVLPGLAMDQVDELVLEMQGHSYTPPAVSLWNHEYGEWERMEIGWGQYAIRDAGAYVAPPGEVLVRLEADTEWPVDVESLTITIKGRR